MTKENQVFLGVLFGIQACELVVSLFGVNYIGILINIGMCVSLGFVLFTDKASVGSKKCLFYSYSVLTLLNIIGAIITICFAYYLSASLNEKDDSEETADSQDNESQQARDELDEHVKTGAVVLSLIASLLAVLRVYFSIYVYKIYASARKE